jgi:predicted nuclease with TOPRIM domain
MFVFKTTYNKLKKLHKELNINYKQLLQEYLKLLNNWNDLIEQINSKGGQVFLDQDIKENYFSDEELKQLLMFVHPDKHQNSKLAIILTQKINNLRNINN